MSHQNKCENKPAVISGALNSKWNVGTQGKDVSTANEIAFLLDYHTGIRWAHPHTPTRKHTHTHISANTHHVGGGNFIWFVVFFVVNVPTWPLSGTSFLLFHYTDILTKGRPAPNSKTVSFHFVVLLHSRQNWYLFDRMFDSHWMDRVCRNEMCVCVLVFAVNMIFRSKWALTVKSFRWYVIAAAILDGNSVSMNINPQARQYFCCWR